MDSHWSSEPLSLELACLDYIKTTLNRAESSLEECEYGFLSDLCRLPGPFVCSVFEYLGRTGGISDFKLKLFRKASDFSLEKLHLADLGSSICGSSLHGFSTYNLKEIVLQFNKNNSNYPTLTDLWDAFRGSEKSLKVLKLYFYPISFHDDGHLFNFVSRFPNLEVFCIHTLLEYCDLNHEKWSNLLRFCPSLKALEVFTPCNKSQISLDTSIFSYFGTQLQSLSLPTILNFHGVLSQQHGLVGLFDLNNLCYLDLSVDDDPEDNTQEAAKDRAERRKFVIDFMEKLEDECLLPKISSLDLSGMKGLHTGHINKFLESHKAVTFLGLSLIEIEYTVMSSVADSVLVSEIVLHD